ncbi:hypothetical protein N9A08_12920 [Arthrobacter koreensis]|uniref:Uncharacterized protein n=1 Tax=Arthrobacter koreensis TaxID=199136 RepID=A0ABY6FQU2_9MICC|nr:hypothetical protein [Arthrobacter koreensis]UYB35518.1 hypothetical protein N9A08_12920 [Arthrobacter koreensis]
MEWTNIASTVLASGALLLSYLTWRRQNRLDDAGKVDLRLQEVKHPEYALINKGSETAWFIEFDLNSAARFHFSDTGPTGLDPGGTWDFKIRNHESPNEKLPSVRCSWRQKGLLGTTTERSRFIVVERPNT